MKPEFQSIFDNTPADAPRSRLEPYRELILRWRRQGRSYRRICQLLHEAFKLDIGKTALHQYVEVRSRPRKPEPDVMPLAPPEPVSRQLPLSAGIIPRRSPQEIEAARAAMRAAYDQPLFSTEEKKPLFERRPGPLSNLNNEKVGDK